MINLRPKELKGDTGYLTFSSSTQFSNMFWTTRLPVSPRATSCHIPLSASLTFDMIWGGSLLQRSSKSFCHTWHAYLWMTVSGIRRSSSCTMDALYSSGTESKAFWMTWQPNGSILRLNVFPLIAFAIAITWSGVPCSKQRWTRKLPKRFTMREYAWCTIASIISYFCSALPTLSFCCKNIEACWSLLHTILSTIYFQSQDTFLSSNRR